MLTIITSSLLPVSLLHFCAYNNPSTPYKRVKNAASYITSNTVNLIINNFSYYLLHSKGTSDPFKKVKLNAFLEDIKICVKFMNLYIIYILSKWKYLGCSYF